MYFRKGKQVGVIHKTGADQKWLDVSQFAWTDAVLDGAEHTKTIGLRFGIPNWDTTTSITFTYTATTLKAAAACTAAIEAKLTELGADYHRPVVGVCRRATTASSCSDLTDYRFYNCSGTDTSLGRCPPNSNTDSVNMAKVTEKNY